MCFAPVSCRCGSAATSLVADDSVAGRLHHLARGDASEVKRQSSTVKGPMLDDLAAHERRDDLVVHRIAGLVEVEQFEEWVEDRFDQGLQLSP